MEVKTLERAFEEAEVALASTDGLVAVWPATTTGFVEEMQVLTEEEWERRLRIGWRLAPDAEVKVLYCFQKVSTGLTASVIRLVSEYQGPRRDQQRLWKLQQTPEVIRRMKDTRTINTKERGESSSIRSAVRQSPPRRVSVATSKTISPEEIQRKRRRANDAIRLAHEPKNTVDEVRPPAKTRRLVDSKGEKKNIVELRVSKRRNKKGDAEEHIEQRGNTIWLRSGAAVSPLIAVNRSTALADPSSSGKEKSASDTSDELPSDTDTHEHPKRTHQLRKTFRECDTLFSTWQQVISAGLGLDSEDEDEESKSASSVRGRVGIECVSAPSSSKPFWSFLESASTRAHKILSDFCGLPSLLAAITAQDSTDYDLLWVEEDDQQHWTMFGEPSTPGRIGVKTRRQQHEAKRAGSRWGAGRSAALSR